MTFNQSVVWMEVHVCPDFKSGRSSEFRYQSLTKDKEVHGCRYLRKKIVFLDVLISVKI